MNYESELDKKLDRILQLIEGEKDAPGLMGRLAHVESMFYGGENTMGINTKVNIMWRVHIWLLCTLSAAAGFALKTFADHHDLFAFFTGQSL